LKDLSVYWTNAGQSIDHVKQQNSVFCQDCQTEAQKISLNLQKKHA